MKLYSNKYMYIASLLYFLVATAAPETITKFAPIIGKNSVKNIYFKKGDESNLMNVGLNIFLNTTTQGSPNRSYYLMLNEAGTVYTWRTGWWIFSSGHSAQHDQRSIVSTSIRRSLLDLTAQDWQNGVYFYPYIVDSNGAFVRSYYDTLAGTPQNDTSGKGADLRLALFDHEWNLIDDDKISMPFQGLPGYAYPGDLNFAPGSMSLMLIGGAADQSKVTVLHQDPASFGNIYFVQSVDNVPEPILDASSQATLYSLPASSVNVGALSVPRGQMKLFTINLDFGTSGNVALALQKGSSNMNTLNTALTTGSVGFDVSLVENSTNGYDATLTAYQDGKSIFAQPFKSLQNQIKQTLKGTAVLSGVSLEYQTDGMGSPGTRALGKVTQFVMVTAKDSAASGTMLAAGETLTQLDAGFILSQGYDQYSVIVPVSSKNIALINQAIKGNQGEIDVTMKLNDSGTNYGVDIVATAGGNQLFTESASNIEFTNMSTKKKAPLATGSNVQVIVENIGYQTTNMTKGMLVPDSSTYSFVPNQQSVIMDLSGYQAPADSDDKSTSDSTNSNPYSSGTGTGSSDGSQNKPTHHVPTSHHNFSGRF